MEIMVLLYKEEINNVKSHLNKLEKIGKEEELKKFKQPILQTINQIREILGAEHWTKSKKIKI